MPPAGILPRHPLDQAAHLGRKRGTAGPATAALSPFLQQCPVPAAKRLRPHRKAGPPLGREQPARRSEQGSIDSRVLRPPPSSPQDRELMAQDHDLKLPFTAAAGEHANDTAQEPVQQPSQQDAQSEPARPPSPARPSRPIRISLPHSFPPASTGSTANLAARARATATALFRSTSPSSIPGST